MQNAISDKLSSFKRKYGKEKSPFIGMLFTLPSILMMIALLFIPMAYAFYLSLFNTSLKNPQPVFIFLNGYIKMFRDPVTLKILLNACSWTLLVTFFQFVVGLWAAMTLNQKFFGRTIVRGIVVLPWVIPGVVAAMIWRLFYDAQLGFLNTLLRNLGLMSGYVDWLGSPSLAMGAVVVAAIWKGFGFSALMYMAALQGIPLELYEAASVDGVNAIQKFFYITIPSIKKIIAMTLILTSIWTFNYFEMIYVMTGGGPLRSTHIPPTYIYELAFRNFNLGDSSRMAVVSILIVGIISMFYIRQIKKKGNF